MDQLNELRICLIRALTIINTLADKIELTEEQQDDFVRLTEVIKKYETMQADEERPQ